jgi:carbon storage regulator
VLRIPAGHIGRLGVLPATGVESEQKLNNNMLVLARKQNQNIVIDGKIIIRVLRVGRDNVKIGIEAPIDIPIHREELLQKKDGDTPPSPEQSSNA